jgi:hypothetical protein
MAEKEITARLARPTQLRSFCVPGIVVDLFAPLDVDLAVTVNELSSPVQGSARTEQVQTPVMRESWIAQFTSVS